MTDTHAHAGDRCVTELGCTPPVDHLDTLGVAHDSGRCAAAGGACQPARHVGNPAPLDLDPLEIFGKLVREVDAARALITMTQGASEKRRAALDSLALARDVLGDVLDELTEP